ncbi:MAG: WbqC family protein [Oscillospiraceae bacterium]|jgi:hypothetical protein|nr:WbqC family protein [Oscillospiraceae bacterium]
MILTGHQPNYWPYPGLLAKINQADVFVYVSEVQLNKQSWQTRNQIKTHDQTIWLCVPVCTSSNYHESIRNITINNSVAWGRKSWRTIRENYCRADFFSEYSGFLEDLYSRKWEKLNELDIYIMNFLIKELNITTRVLYDTDLELHGSKTDLLVDMCRKTDCDTYLSSRGSKAYLEIEKFTQVGLTHVYMDWICPEYTQLHGKFEPNLSMLDMLLNVGKEETEKIIKNRKIAFLAS